jgi:MFS family permease
MAQAKTVWQRVWHGGGRAILAVGTLFILMETLTIQGPFIQLYAQDSLSYTKAEVNLLFSAGPLVAIVISLLGGRLISTFGPRIVLLIGIVGFAPMLALWLGARGFAAGMWLFTVGYVFLQVAIIAYETLRSGLVEGKGRGLALGILGAMTGAVASLGPAVAGWLVEVLGPLTPFVMAFASVGLMVVILIRSISTARAQKPGQSEGVAAGV